MSSHHTDPAHHLALTSSTPWYWPALVAHRGGGTLAPENTLAAFRAGHAQGFKMMEYDVKLSSDGVPILLHDDTIGRTSNGTGLAAELTIADLLHHDFGAWHSVAYAGEPIPSLYAIAAYTLAHDVCSNIEIKPSPGTEAETGYRVACVAHELWRAAKLPPLISSFSEVALAAAKDAAPELPRALLIEADVPADWQSRVERLQCTGLNLNHKHVTQALAHEITSAGYTLAVWTVNDLARAQQLLNWGCHAIVTDHIATINPAAFPNLHPA